MDGMTRTNTLSQCRVRHHHECGQTRENVTREGVLFTHPVGGSRLPSAVNDLCESGKRRKTGAFAQCTMDNANCFHMIRLELKTYAHDMKVTVVSTAAGCDVTTVQQHYKGLTSTPPRVARLCQIREESLVAQKISHQNKILRLLTCVDRSTRPIHHTSIH